MDKTTVEEKLAKLVGDQEVAVNNIVELDAGAAQWREKRIAISGAIALCRQLLSEEGPEEEAGSAEEDVAEKETDA